MIVFAPQLPLRGRAVDSRDVIGEVVYADAFFFEPLTQPCGNVRVNDLPSGAVGLFGVIKSDCRNNSSKPDDQAERCQDGSADVINRMVENTAFHSRASCFAGSKL